MAWPRLSSDYVRAPDTGEVSDVVALVVGGQYALHCVGGPVAVLIGTGDPQVKDSTLRWVPEAGAMFFTADRVELRVASISGANVGVWVRRCP